MLEDEIAGRYFQTIAVPQLKEFVRNAMTEYSSPSKLREANSVILLVLDILKKKRQVSENNRPTWIDVMVAAGLLHNLFYDGTLPSLFMAREKLMPIAKELNVPPQMAVGIFQTIESQLGDDTPVEALIPPGNSPNSVFAMACWLVEERNGKKEMPKCVPI